MVFIFKPICKFFIPSPKPAFMLMLFILKYMYDVDCAKILAIIETLGLTEGEINSMAWECGGLRAGRFNNVPRKVAFEWLRDILLHSHRRIPETLKIHGVTRNKADPAWCFHGVDPTRVTMWWERQKTLDYVNVFNLVPTWTIVAKAFKCYPRSVKKYLTRAGVNKVTKRGFHFLPNRAEEDFVYVCFIGFNNGTWRLKYGRAFEIEKCYQGDEQVAVLVVIQWWKSTYKWVCEVEGLVLKAYRSLVLEGPIVFKGGRRETFLVSDQMATLFIESTEKAFLTVADQPQAVAVKQAKLSLLDTAINEAKNNNERPSFTKKFLDVDLLKLDDVLRFSTPLAMVLNASGVYVLEAAGKDMVLDLATLTRTPPLDLPPALTPLAQALQIERSKESSDFDLRNMRTYAEQEREGQIEHAQRIAPRVHRNATTELRSFFPEEQSVLGNSGSTEASTSGEIPAGPVNELAGQPASPSAPPQSPQAVQAASHNQGQAPALEPVEEVQEQEDGSGLEVASVTVSFLRYKHGLLGAFMLVDAKISAFPWHEVSCVAFVSATVYRSYTFRPAMGVKHRKPWMLGLAFMSWFTSTICHRPLLACVFVPVFVTFRYVRRVKLVNKPALPNGGEITQFVSWALFVGLPVINSNVTTLKIYVGVRFVWCYAFRVQMVIGFVWIVWKPISLLAYKSVALFEVGVEEMSNFRPVPSKPAAYAEIWCAMHRNDFRL